MGGEDIVAPYLDYSQIEASAEHIISEYHASRSLPIPADDIIDPGMGIDIFPQPGLTRTIAGEDGIVAYINSSLDLITVDQDAWERQTPRFRFSLSHELAHCVLHQSVFEHLRFDTIAEWKTAMRVIPEKQYDWLEWQAYCFAGLLLVPTAELGKHLAVMMRLAEENSLDTTQDATRTAIEKRLADVFRVSSAVIHKRLDKSFPWQ